MATPLKDFVDRSVVDDLRVRFEAVDVEFDGVAFARVADALDDLELKPRVEAIALALSDALTGGYARALPTVLDVARAEPPVEGWAAWPLAAFVELFGADAPDLSLPAMEHVTKRMSCEFAIRPLLRDHFDQAYEQLEVFTEHDDERVRRLPSEGTRPRLPWGMRVQRLIDEPEHGLALVERLRHDPSEDVRRSVANHLNDVAKYHPGLVVDAAERWLVEPETDQRMVSHALRTLVKQGHPGALAALGFSTDPDIDVEDFTVGPNRVGMGDRIELVARVRSTATARQRLVVDFVIHHVNASGATSPKVFKWTTLELDRGEGVQLRKRRLIQQASTRTYRAGTHVVELQIAGEIVATTSFEIDV